MLKMFENEEGRAELEKQWQLKESQERWVITKFSADPAYITTVFLFGAFSSNDLDLMWIK